MSKLLHVYTEPGDDPVTTSEVVFDVGGVTLGGVKSFSLEELKPGELIEATIKLHVRIGKPKPEKVQTNISINPYEPNTSLYSSNIDLEV